MTSQGRAREMQQGLARVCESPQSHLTHTQSGIYPRQIEAVLSKPIRPRVASPLHNSRQDPTVRHRCNVHGKHTSTTGRTAHDMRGPTHQRKPLELVNVLEARGVPSMDTGCPSRLGLCFTSLLLLQFLSYGAWLHETLYSVPPPSLVSRQ